MLRPALAIAAFVASFVVVMGGAAAQYRPPLPSPPPYVDEADDWPDDGDLDEESMLPPGGRPPYGVPGQGITRQELPPPGGSNPYGQPLPIEPGTRPPSVATPQPGVTPPSDDRFAPPVPIGPGDQTAISSLPPEDQPETGEPAELPPHLRRQMVDYSTKEPAGTLIIDTAHTYLYYVLGNGKAVRYGIGVGRDGFTWSGKERVSRMSEWPDWYPPADMIERQPYLPRMMAGGPGNPLGARALYLGNTLYRIHGTNQPSTIGKFVSSGCIRLTNADIEDLYRRAHVGTRVVVLPGSKSPKSAATE